MTLQDYINLGFNEKQAKSLLKNGEYYRDRFIQLEDSLHNKGVSYLKDLDEQFLIAQRDIEKEIRSWYQRFAINNGISLADARKWLTTKELAELKWDVNEYIKYGQDKALMQLWSKQLENASAKYHISRLESLKIQTQQTLEVLYGNHLDGVDSLMRNIYTDGFYHTAFEVHKGVGVGWDIAAIDQRKLEKVISKPWAVDGKNFSERIWGNKQKLINEVHKEVTQMCVLGKSPDQAIKNISKAFDSTKKQAGKLVMTEAAYFSSASQKDCFNELDVELFEIVATLDSHTSAICQEMDGKVFPMSQYEVGVTAPPFHPWCRTVTVPAFDDEFGIGERAARGEDGKTYYVPSDMKYKQWKDSFVDSDDESKDDLIPVDEGDKIKVKKEPLKKLDKLKDSGMDEVDYNEYLKILNNHENPTVRNIYSLYADQLKQAKYKPKSGAAYQPSANTITFNYPTYDDMNKYGTLAHEYGHFFDAKVPFEGLHFKEIESVRNVTTLTHTFPSVASSSDEFLEALRKDKDHLKSIFTPEVKADLIAHNASNGVQDAIDGLFSNSRVRWGHGEKYYNRKYSDIVFMDKMARTSLKKDLQNLYKELGFDVSNQTKVKMICRQYEAASEVWANIMSAEVCGGESLEYVKKYLPNSYKAMLEILKGVK